MSFCTDFLRHPILFGVEAKDFTWTMSLHMVELPGTLWNHLLLLFLLLMLCQPHQPPCYCTYIQTCFHHRTLALTLPSAWNVLSVEDHRSSFLPPPKKTLSSSLSCFIFPPYQHLAGAVLYLPSLLSVSFQWVVSFTKAVVFICLLACFSLAPSTNHQ